MHLTDRTDIGLRLLIFLTVHGGRASVGAVAEAFNVSEAHLAKVAQALAKAGIVETLPGRTGGVQLAKAAEDIRVGAIVRLLEPLALVECFGEDNHCPVVGVCGLQLPLAEAREAFLAVLDAVTIADAAAKRAGLRSRLGQGAGPDPVTR
jgi:Rrf2 family nitric oxide-sensitive transcriptional repressor